MTRTGKRTYLDILLGGHGIEIQPAVVAVSEAVLQAVGEEMLQHSAIGVRNAATKTPKGRVHLCAGGGAQRCIGRGGGVGALKARNELRPVLAIERRVFTTAGRYVLFASENSERSREISRCLLAAAPSRVAGDVQIRRPKGPAVCSADVGHGPGFGADGVPD